MRKLLEQIDKYNVEVDLDLIVEDYYGDVYYPKKVILEYSMEIEYRSWGIKDIYLYFDKPLEFSYSLEDGEEKELKVPLEDAEVNWTAGGFIAPESIEIKIDKEGKVLSKSINAVYLEKGY